MNQHDHEYLIIQNAIAHADKLWQTLNREKIHQELKKDRKKTQCQYESLDQHHHDDFRSQDQSKEWNSHQNSQQELHDSEQFSRWDYSRSKNCFFTKKHEYCRQNYFCF